MPKQVDYKGRRFGKLVAIEYTGKLLRSLIRSFLSDSHNPPTSPQKTTVLTLEILHEAILNIDERLTALENF